MVRRRVTSSPWNKWVLGTVLTKKRKGTWTNKYKEVQWAARVLMNSTMDFPLVINRNDKVFRYYSDRHQY